MTPDTTIPAPPIAPPAEVEPAPLFTTTVPCDFQAGLDRPRPQPWSLPAPPAGQAWTAEQKLEPWTCGDEIKRSLKGPWDVAGASPNDSLNNLTSPETSHCRTRRPLPASQPEQASPAEDEVGTDPKGEAGKAKAPLALLPPEALRQAAWAHSNGAAKYGPFNWRENKVCATTYISAMMRHLGQYLDGEDADAESGLSHLAHVIASANILIDAKHCGTLVDDRPKRPA